MQDQNLKQSFRALSVGRVLMVGINKAHRAGHAQKASIHENEYSKSYNGKTEFTFVAE